MAEGLLFEVTSVGPAAVAPRVPVVKTFRRFDPAQGLLLPPSVEEWLPSGHLARFVAELVDEVLDLSAFYADYTEARGYPPHDPQLMVRLLVYGYCTGVRSSRAIERACTDVVAFRFLAAGQVPDFRSIGKFRRRHLVALEGLLLQSVQLAQRMGLVKLGRVALDGTKLRAAASKHKAMSFGRLEAVEEKLEAEVAELESQISAILTEAETLDAAEDARWGTDGKPADLPAELARRETRLAKAQAAKASLQADAEAKARSRAEQRERDRQARERARRAAPKASQDPVEPTTSEPTTSEPPATEPVATKPERTPNSAIAQEPAVQEQDVRLIALAGERAAQAATPESKAQCNFTDPDSRIMKNADGAFIQAYNGQAVVDDAAQIIVAADVTDCASDVPSLLPMLAQADANTGQAPVQALADAGYCSKDNLAALVARAQHTSTQVLVATGRLRHGEVPATPTGTGTAPAGGQANPGVISDKERMAGLLRTDAGRAAYARRKAIVEPVFGQMSTRQNAKQLRLRGTHGARGEWRLLAGCHNILKMFTSGLPIAAGTALALG